MPIHTSQHSFATRPFPRHAHFLPVVGVEPNRWQPSPDNRRHTACGHGAGHTTPVPTTVPGWPYHADWCHHRVGARPRPSRCQALATPTKAGYHSDTIINGRSLGRVGYHTQSNNGRGIRMVGYHTHLIYCYWIVIFLNKNRVILSTRLTFRATCLASYFAIYGKVWYNLWQA